MFGAIDALLFLTNSTASCHDTGADILSGLVRQKSAFSDWRRIAKNVLRALPWLVSDGTGFAVEMYYHDVPAMVSTVADVAKRTFIVQKEEPQA